MNPTKVLARQRSLWVGVALAALLVLRIVYAAVLRVNGDEPQHLHVVWAWTQGLLPYRDVFDNHAPLFHLLCAPLLMLFGERADIIVCMRLAMVPVYFACLWIIWRIGVRLWSREVGALAVALCAAYPAFFLSSCQFRADDLWALLWIATIGVLVGGAFNSRRSMSAGLLVGAAIATSLKTLPLLIAASVAAISVAAILAIRRRNVVFSGRAILSLAIGTIIVPGILCAWFVAHDGWAALSYCLFEHNLVSELGRWSDGLLRFLLVPLSLPPALWIAWRSCPTDGDWQIWARRTFLLLAAVGYAAVLYGYWPLITPQDLLPVVPLSALAVAVLLLQVCSALPMRGRHAIGGLLVAAELATLFVVSEPWHNRAHHYRDFLARILTLTEADDPVMDSKGETVYRTRPIYWVLENITQARMKDGSIRDDIAERLVHTGTAVVIATRLPERDLEFVEANYLPITRHIGVAGKRLGTSAARVPLHFSIALPIEYAIVTRAGAAIGMLDGRTSTLPQTLGVGAHEFIAQQSGDYLLVWAPALQRGVSAQRLFAGRRFSARDDHRSP